MGGLSKPLRPSKKGLSNLGGITKLVIFTIDQFTPDAAEWPNRAAIATNGEISTSPPIISGETAGRIIFDLEGGLKVKAALKGPSSNQSYLHSFEGGKIAGYTTENQVAMNDLYNMPFVAIVTRPNGQKVVVGTTHKPLMLDGDYDSGGKADDWNGTTISAKQVQECDFRPAILASSVTIAETTVPAYS